MRGATAPRLLLEMMCARILLPGVDDTAEGLGARIDRMERRLSVVGDAGSGSTASLGRPQRPGRPPASCRVPDRHPRDAGAEPPAEPCRARRAGRAGPRRAASGSPGRRPPATESRRTRPRPSPAPSAAAGSRPAHAGRRTPAVAGRARPGQEGPALRLDPAQPERPREGCRRQGHHDRPGQRRCPRQLHPIRCRRDPAPGPDRRARRRLAGRVDHRQRPARPAAPASYARSKRHADGAGRIGRPADDLPPSRRRRPRRPRSRLPRRQCARPASRATGAADDEAADTSHTEVAEDDDVIDDASLSGQELLARELGAQVIEEIEHES